MKKCKTFIQTLDYLWSMVTGRNHNYRIVFGYKQKGQTRSTEITMYRTFSMSWRPSGDDFYREIRKHFGPNIVKDAAAMYGRLNNGRVTIEDIQYVGRF
ncbi:hypothetical protein [Aeromonas phage 59.1]|nr:hypothetical protein [Aeromonas phage 59.1]